MNGQLFAQVIGHCGQVQLPHHIPRHAFFVFHLALSFLACLSLIIFLLCCLHSFAPVPFYLPHILRSSTSFLSSQPFIHS